MNTFLLNRNFRKLLSLGNYAVRVTFADAVLCAVCGALYGIVFGGFGAQARNELTVSGVFSIGGTCAMVGLAIGAAVGVFSEVSRVRNLRQRLSERATRNAATLTVKQLSRLPATLMPGVLQHRRLSLLAQRSRESLRSAGNSLPTVKTVNENTFVALMRMPFN